MFDTIVLATDSSANAERAAVVAGQLATACGATLVIVHVTPAFTGLMEVMEDLHAGRFPQPVEEEIEALAKASAGWEKTPFSRMPAPESAVRHLAAVAMERSAVIARDNGAKKIEQMVLEGDPATAIVGEARRRKAGLIVLGSRGLSDLKGLVMGSVSHKVLQLSDCPCVTVK